MIVDTCILDKIKVLLYVVIFFRNTLSICISKLRTCWKPLVYLFTCFENCLNKIKLVQSRLNIFLALKLARYEPIIQLLCDSIQFLC